MAFNLSQYMLEPPDPELYATDAGTTSTPTSMASTETSEPVYSYLADGAVRQAQGSAAFDLLTSDGWKTIGTPQHAESLYYVTTALSSPVMAEFLKFAAENPDQLNREQQLFMQNPLTSLDSYGQGFRWGENSLYDNVLTPQFSGTVQQVAGYDATQLTAEEQKTGAEFNYTESAEQQAARAGSDDDFLGIALMVAAMVFAPYIVPEIAATLGVSETVAAAIYGGTKSLVTGGDIGDVLTSAVLGGAGAELSSGAAVGSEGDWYAAMTGGEALGSGDFGGPMASAGPSAFTPGAEGTMLDAPVQNVVGTPELPSAGPSYTSEDYRWDMEMPSGAGPAVSGPSAPAVSPAFTPSAENYAQAYPGEGSFGPSSIVSAGDGIIAKWMEPFKGLDKGQAMLVGSGVVAAGNLVGGGFKALLEKSALEEKMQADKDLVAQKFAQDTTGKRDFVQSNPSVFNWRRRFTPTGQPLRRLSTGRPVYQGGLIASRMRGA